SVVDVNTLPTVTSNVTVTDASRGFADYAIANFSRSQNVEDARGIPSVAPAPVEAPMSRAEQEAIARSEIAAQLGLHDISSVTFGGISHGYNGHGGGGGGGQGW